MTSNYTYTIQFHGRCTTFQFCSKRIDRRAAADTPIFSISAVISVVVWKLSRTDA